MKRMLTLLLFPASLVHAEADPSKVGSAIASEASAKLIAALTAALAQGGPQGSIGVCSEKAPEIAEAVGRTHGVTLRRLTEKPRNPESAASEAERKILAAFAMDMKDGKAPEARVIEEPEGNAFLAPIVIPSALCLHCHGDPSGDIAPETLAAIRKLYPEDKAIGYKLGDLRGAWTVTFDPKP